MGKRKSHQSFAAEFALSAVDHLNKNITATFGTSLNSIVLAKICAILTAELISMRYSTLPLPLPNDEPTNSA